eukprot:6180214-Pleurochrysis_carterae.AAC.5
MDNAKPPRDPKILRTECELRLQGTNQLCDGGERGDRKSGRAVTKPRRSSTLNSAANFLLICRLDALSPSPQTLLLRTRRRRRRALPVFFRVAALPRDPIAPLAPSTLASSSTTTLVGPSSSFFLLSDLFSSHIRKFSSNSAGSKFWVSRPPSPAGDARRPQDQQSSGKPYCTVATTTCPAWAFSSRDGTCGQALAPGYIRLVQAGS